MAIAHKTSLRFLLALLFVAASTAACAAQPRTSTPASPLPKKPATLLALVAQRNGLHGPGLKPWHILATYQLYDAKGNPTEKGVFEEWWNSPNEYKISFNRPSYHMQIVVNSKGTFVSGNDVIPYPEFLIERLYLDPASARLPSPKMRLYRQAKALGKAKFDCVVEVPHGLNLIGGTTIRLLFPTYCMQPSTPLLRVFGSWGQGLIEVTKTAMLEDRFLAEDAVIYDRSRRYLTAHLVQAESTNQWDASLFTAPPGVHSAPNQFDTIFKTAAVTAGEKIGGEEPAYPSTALEKHEAGTVVLSVLIAPDGQVRNPIVVAAPAMSLARSALTAVKSWKYKPYLLNGHPTSVQTTINVVYSIGHPNIGN